MRVAPDAKTWAAVELWWAAPTHVGQDRLACFDRRRTVFAVMLPGARPGARAERLSLLPGLPEEFVVVHVHAVGPFHHQAGIPQQQQDLSILILPDTVICLDIFFPTT